jgi:2-polyprenyl-3-methyl-5-hydroxy-6-metoxy-1,4-benzoquinol methylase
MEQSEINSKAGKHWDRVQVESKNRPETRTRWWEDDTTRRHVNNIVSNSDTVGLHDAFHRRISQFFEGRKNLKAISVGCGTGIKEMWLTQMINIVNFDLYDISETRIAAGKEEAARQGLLNKVNLFNEDAFSADVATDYDMVYWNNALHHMSNVENALRWSYDRLKLGGLLAMVRWTRTGGPLEAVS